MESTHPNCSNAEPNPERLQQGIFSQNNMIAIYTVLSILRKMEHELGLEAMLEYVQQYLISIEKHNPQIKYAVSRALQLIQVEKIYKEAVHERQE